MVSQLYNNRTSPEDFQPGILVPRIQVGILRPQVDKDAAAYLLIDFSPEER